MTIPSKVMRETELEEIETLSAHYQKGALHNTVRHLIENQRLLLSLTTDLTKKVQYLLDAYIPNKTVFQYMFPDGDTWIVRPKEVPFDIAKIYKLPDKRCPECVEKMGDADGTRAESANDFLEHGGHFDGCSRDPACS